MSDLYFLIRDWLVCPNCMSRGGDGRFKMADGGFSYVYECPECDKKTEYGYGEIVKYG